MIEILEKKDCPFCGKQPKGYPHGWYVECPECKVRINGISYENAVKRWNTRYEPTRRMLTSLKDQGIIGCPECGMCTYFIDLLPKYCQQCGMKFKDIEE